MRSRKCRILASTKICDTCVECEALKSVSINRSVLSSSTSTSTPSSKSSSHQKSVWQMAEGSEAGVVFVCPQLQSFNASLPQTTTLPQGRNCFAFGSSDVNKQHLSATSVVEHKVVISGGDLQAEVFLNGRKVARQQQGKLANAMRDFEKDKQVRVNVHTRSMRVICQRVFILFTASTSAVNACS